MQDDKSGVTLAGEYYIRSGHGDLHERLLLSSNGRTFLRSTVAHCSMITCWRLKKKRVLPTSHVIHTGGGLTAVVVMQVLASRRAVPSILVLVIRSTPGLTSMA